MSAVEQKPKVDKKAKKAKGKDANASEYPLEVVYYAFPS
jgi:hypothetical protein